MCFENDRDVQLQSILNDYFGLIDVWKNQYERPLHDACIARHPDAEQFIVANVDLHNVNASRIRMIVVADNPGDHEQQDGVYLHPEGKSGSAIRRIFQEKVQMEFGDNILVLNKTPIYSHGTVDLRRNLQGHDHLQEFLKLTQREMARITFGIHSVLPDSQLAVFGYGACQKQNGTFQSGVLFEYFRALVCAYQDSPLRAKVLLHQHPANGCLDGEMNRRHTEVTGFERFERIGRENAAFLPWEIE